MATFFSRVRRSATGARTHALAVTLCWLVAASGAADTGYTVNAQSLPLEQAYLLAEAGLPPGGYWLDPDGNFGIVGEPIPLLRLTPEDIQATGPWPPFQALPPSASTPSSEPVAPPPPSAPPKQERASPRPKQGRVAGVDGTRLFWIQTSILSNNGASGYVHFCPGGLVYTSSEGSFMVGGAGSGSAGGAYTSNASGRWSLAEEDGQPYVNVHYGDGSSEWYWVAALKDGRSWRSGQYRFAAEPGKATCP